MSSMWVGRVGRDGWSSKVIGSLRAPSVLITTRTLTTPTATIKTRTAAVK